MLLLINVNKNDSSLGRIALRELNDDDVNQIQDSSDNYFTLKYGEDVAYSGNFLNRKDVIDFISIEGQTLSPKDSFTVSANSEVKIYIKNNTTDLSDFFYYNYDQNVIKIISLNFSHFNSSLITNLDGFFSFWITFPSRN